MEKTIPFTKEAYQLLSRRQSALQGTIDKKAKPTVERQHEVNAARKELHEINQVLEAGFVREFNEKQPAMVQIGSTVVIEDMKSGDKREYRIMTRTTAEPLKGVISNESPIAQRMLGLYLKNTFKFRDNYGKDESYKITSIE